MITAADLRRYTRERWNRILYPPRRLTVSQWADQERYLSPEYNPDAQRARGPVRWGTDRVPYLRGIMDALGDESIREITVQKSSQVGGTECEQNWLGWTIVERPTPTLVVWPTDTMLRAFSTKRLDPMIRDTPALHRRIRRSARRDSSNTIAAKQFAGGYIQMLSAKSTAQLRSFSAQQLIAEEVDEWEGSVGDQGDPLELLRARGIAFEATYTLFKVSTPTLEDFSRITREYADSSQGTYHVPCPACGAEQPLVWQDAEGRYRLVCDRGPDGELIPETARYLCDRCGALIAERERPAMLAAGRWVHQFPVRIPRNCGFFIWAAYSPFVSWARIVHQFLRTRRDPRKLRTFVNLWLGLPFKEQAQELQPHFLAARAEAYPRDEQDQELVPAGAGVVTAAVDVQGDRLEVFPWGWGAEEEAWFLRWIILEGDPGQAAVWGQLREVLLTPLVHAGGARLRIASMAIDAGYQTERVWTFAEAHAHLGVFPTVGRDGRGRPLLQAPAPRRIKRARREARPMWVVGVDSAKDELAARLRITEPGPRYMHFPESVDAVFYDQLTAEKLVTTYRRGYATRTWQLIPGRRNEALDGTILAMAALVKLGPRVMRNLAAIVAQVQATGASPATVAAPVPRRRVRHRGID